MFLDWNALTVVVNGKSLASIFIGSSSCKIVSFCSFLKSGEGGILLF